MSNHDTWGTHIHLPYYVGYNAVLVRLSRVHRDVLRDLLGMAYKFVTRNAAPRAESSVQEHEQRRDSESLTGPPDPRGYHRAVVLGMRGQFGYRGGLFLDLPAGRGASNGKSKLEWL